MKSLRQEDILCFLSINQLAAPSLLLLKTMAIRHADIINNAWQPFVSNDQFEKLGEGGIEFDFI